MIALLWRFDSQYSVISWPNVVLHCREGLNARPHDEAVSPNKSASTAVIRDVYSVKLVLFADRLNNVAD